MTAPSFVKVATLLSWTFNPKADHSKLFDSQVPTINSRFFSRLVPTREDYPQNGYLLCLPIWRVSRVGWLRACFSDYQNREPTLIARFALALHRPSSESSPQGSLNCLSQRTDVIMP